MTEARTEEIRRYIEDHGDDPISTRNVVQLVVDMHTGELFRAALALWVASAAEPQLRQRVVTLETPDRASGAPGHRPVARRRRTPGGGAAADPGDPRHGTRPGVGQPARRRPATIIEQWSALLDGKV